MGFDQLSLKAHFFPAAFRYRVIHLTKVAVFVFLYLGFSVVEKEADTHGSLQLSALQLLLRLHFCELLG
jgi:hypothetical protein